MLHLAHDAEAARAVLSRALAAEMVGLLRAPDAQLAGAALRVVARLLEQPALPDLPGGAAGSWAGGAAGARTRPSCGRCGEKEKTERSGAQTLAHFEKTGTARARLSSRTSSRRWRKRRSACARPLRGSRWPSSQ